MVVAVAVVVVILIVATVVLSVVVVVVVVVVVIVSTLIVRSVGSVVVGFCSFWLVGVGCNYCEHFTGHRCSCSHGPDQLYIDPIASVQPMTMCSNSAYYSAQGMEYELKLATVGFRTRCLLDTGG